MKEKGKSKPVWLPDDSLVHGLVKDDDVSEDNKTRLPITWQETDYFEYNQLGGPLRERFTDDSLL